MFETKVQSVTFAPFRNLSSARDSREVPGTLQGSFPSFVVKVRKSADCRTLQLLNCLKRCQEKTNWIPFCSVLIFSRSTVIKHSNKILNVLSLKTNLCKLIWLSKTISYSSVCKVATWEYYLADLIDLYITIEAKGLVQRSSWKKKTPLIRLKVFPKDKVRDISNQVRRSSKCNIEF